MNNLIEDKEIDSEIDWALSYATINLIKEQELENDFIFDDFNELSKYNPLEDITFDSIVSMMIQYKNNYGKVDLPIYIIQDLTLLYKIRKIQMTKAIAIKKPETNAIYSLTELENIFEKLDLDMPAITEEEFAVYDYNVQFNDNKKSSLYKEDIDEYYIFRDYLFGFNRYNQDFNYLIHLYHKDKIDFYAACIKSQTLGKGFRLKIGSHILNLCFQTQDYDNTFKRYMAGLRNLKLLIPILDKNINRIKMCGKGIKQDSKAISFIFAEHYELLYGFRVIDRFEDSYSNNGGSPASYSHSRKRIDFYYNYFCKPIKYNDKASLFHEFGHFLHYTYCDRNSIKDRNSEMLKSFLIKDYKLAFRNIKFLRHYPAQPYYKHVSPPLDILAKKKNNINDNTYSSELFAEIVCNLMILEIPKRKQLRSSKLKYLNEIFPHANYLVDQILKGKGVNKYKQFKK